MWTNPLTIALVAAGSSLLTMLVAPWLQHHFWRYQRRAELRLAAINEFTRLTSDFITDFIADEKNYKPAPDWFKALSTLGSNIKTLFSEAPYPAFKKLEEMIGPGPGLGPQGKKSPNDFVDARDAALRALYREVIPLGRWRDLLRCRR